MLGPPWYNTRPHAPMTPSFLGMDALMTSQLNVALIRRLRGSLMCLAYFLTCYLWLFVQPVLADVRSTSAQFKCLYSTFPFQVQSLEYSSEGPVESQSLRGHFVQIFTTYDIVLKIYFDLYSDICFYRYQVVKWWPIF